MGYRIAKTQGRNSAPLPRRAIAVLDPELMLVTDVFPCEDGYAQERSILPEVLETVEAGQLWMGDRNFCTTGFVFRIADRNAYLLTRQHKQNLYWEPVGRRRRIGQSATGVVYEQTVRLTESDADDADELIVHWVTIVLDTPTRDGDTEIHLLTNVSSEDADAIQIAALYLARWTIENVFQEISTALNSEINTLAYPSAAILGFCIALPYAVVQTSSAIGGWYRGEFSPALPPLRIFDCRIIFHARLDGISLCLMFWPAGKTTNSLLSDWSDWHELLARTGFEWQIEKARPTDLGEIIRLSATPLPQGSPEPRPRAAR